MFRKSLACSLLIALLGAGNVAPSWAEESATDDQAILGQLLRSGEKHGPAALAAAREQYASLHAKQGDAPELDYAFALVLAHHRKYREALPLVTAYVATGDRPLTAHCVQIWLQLHDRRNRDAYRAAVQLADRFPTAVDAPAEEQYASAAHFLGTVFAFQELVRPVAGDADLRRQSKHDVRKRIGATYLPVFDAARSTIADRMAATSGRIETAKRKSEQARSEQQQATSQELSKHHSIVSEQDITDQSHAERLRDSQREWGIVQQQLATLADARGRLTAQIVSVQAQIAQLMQSTNTLIDNTQPGNPRRVLTNTTSYVDPGNRYVLQALAMTLTSLDRQAFQVDRKMMQLQMRAGELGVQGDHESQALARSEQTALQAQRKAEVLEGKLKRLEKTPASNSANVPPLAFSSFAPLPYEDELERLSGTSAAETAP